MDKINPPLKKTCKNCGLEKPLTAFLQLSDKHNNTYGSICAACRKIHSPILNNTEENTDNKTDLRIGHKEKIAGDINRKERQKQTEEAYYTEREDEEEQQLSRTQTIENTLKHEKKHRKTYLENVLFLNTNPTIESGDTPIFGGIEQMTKEGTLNLAVPVIDTAIPKVKHQSVMFQQFKTWLGASAPIVTAAERLISNQKTQPDKNKPPLSSDYIEKTWGPPTKPKRSSK